ncbi:MAG: PAS domain S-box protein [Rhodospirillaceae bacterium]|jgi:PAS domain S-box-containing protein|nr:PAS domain S-box protein [Rhodospirillaceae bacterium]MBT5179014.1 PAS domain S-box protein [Rhodospirillaceae bacterium]MBT5840725.1 PAS domain S-box protein [Rhodospirillaceae bacterium]MBT6860554.1 PAS domain S-box protein [Rhodospirillaceae bacterium]MBT7031757.1 PAS domain S-box protein [Rhodospirillaceae bacterium]
MRISPPNNFDSLLVRVFGVAALTAITVLVLAVAWEFKIEDSVLSFLGIQHIEESNSERWRYIVTSVGLTALALIIPIWLLSRSIGQRIAIQNLQAESEKNWRDLINSAPESIFMIDKDGTVLEANEIGASGFRLTADELIGRSIFAVVPPNVAEERLGFLCQMLEKPETVVTLDSRGDRWFETIASPHLNEQGEVEKISLFARDITKRVQAEEDARRQHEQLAHVLRIATIDEMASGIAHELNQPLAAITAYINGSLRHLEAGDLPSRSIAEALEKASEQTIRAGNVIQRLRDYTRRENLQSENVSINDTIQTAMQLIQPELELNQVALTLDLAQPSLAFNGDPILIQQVIINLVSNGINAMKSHPPGSGKLTINTTAEDGMILIGVTDNGPGIEPGIHEELFNPYFTTNESGLGLGLAICQSIVDKHDGQIWCEPAPQEGAEFRIRLPWSVAEITE